MKKILFIATGGTIASAKTENGLTPAITSEELLNAVPQVKNLCAVDTVQPYSLDSTNMCWKQWIHVAEIIRDNYAKYDGFVIAHGTDTMAYTAAALSYLVQGSPKPIVLTGAQKPIWFDGTDSKRNLTDAFLYACRGCGGVQIVFNGKVILGTRARKTCSKSFHAFSSVNYPDLAVVQDEHLLQYIRCESRPRPLFYDRLDPHVGLLKLIPGTNPEVLRMLMDMQYKGIVLETFGAGGMHFLRRNLLPEMQQLTDRGFTALDSRTNFVFASTERINGGALYKELKKNGILVRHFDAPRIQNWLRITIGTPEQMQTFMETLDKIMEE